jgi:anti-sigma B factor antagonist
MAELGDGSAELVIDAQSTPGVIRLSGELDSSNAARLETALAAVLSPRPELVVFEMSGLRFMDSAGISVLVKLAAEVETVRIRDPSPIVRRVIEITGLTGVLRIE